MTDQRPPRKSAMNLATALTDGRCLAVPSVVACFFWHGSFQPHDVNARWAALVIFTLAAITDYFDGWVARAFDQVTTVGRMLDPIADKLLVAACLLLLAAAGTIDGWSIWAAVIILSREILVSGLREFLADLRVSVPVSRVAKWKTTAQLVSLGFLLAGHAGDVFLARLLAWANVGTAPCTQTGIALLWLAAMLTLYTGWDYFREGARYLRG